MYGLHYVGGWWMTAMVVFMVLVWGGLAALAVLSFRWFSKHNAAAERQTPLDIAKERYAKGEITKEQFEQIKKDVS